MERPRCDKQHKVRFDRSIFGIDRAAFHNGQNVPLDPFPGYVRAAHLLLAGDLIDLVNKDDAVLLRFFHRLPDHLIHVDALIRFILDQDPAGILNGQPAFFLFGRDQAPHHLVQVDVDAHGQHGVSRRLLLHFHLHQFLFQLPGP